MQWRDCLRGDPPRKLDHTVVTHRICSVTPNLYRLVKCMQITPNYAKKKHAQKPLCSRAKTPHRQVNTRMQRGAKALQQVSEANRAPDCDRLFSDLNTALCMWKRMWAAGWLREGICKVKWGFRCYSCHTGTHVVCSSVYCRHRLFDSELSYCIYGFKTLLSRNILEEWVLQCI